MTTIYDDDINRAAEELIGTPTCWCGESLINIYIAGVPHKECPIHSTAFISEATQLPWEKG